MSDRRKGFRRHIRAAREWLGQAEVSLEKKNDVRGDLKLMLAEAELKRARETGEISSRQGWFRRMLPVGMAAFLAAGGFLFLQAGQIPVHQAEPVQNVVQETAAVPEKPEPAAAADQTVQQEHADAPAAQTTQKKPVQEAALLQQAAAREVQHSEAGIPAVQPESKPARQASMPSEHMQQLMQSAGKTLRAQ